MDDIAANLASAKVQVRRAIAGRTPHHEVKQILQERTDRHRTRLPVQDSSPATAGRRANHPNRSTTSE